MLNENEPLPQLEVARHLLPSDIKDQIPWDKMEGVVVLQLSSRGESNRIFASSITVQELAFLCQQLQAHVNYILTGTNGKPPLEEGY